MLIICYTERVEADGVPRDQGTSYYSRRCDHGHEQYHERHAAKLRGHLQTELYPGIVPHHRREVLVP
jgi:hypothetical protein